MPTLYIFCALTSVDRVKTREISK